MIEAGRRPPLFLTLERGSGDKVPQEVATFGPPPRPTTHTGNFSITAAYTVAPGIRGGIGFGYTNNPTPVVFTPQTGSALNLLANVVTYW